MSGENAVAALTKKETSNGESEAALLALADGLDFGVPTGMHSQARFGASLYKVQITRHTTTGSKWSAWWRPDGGGIGSDCDILFDSLENAQAACTRHASTGRWTPDTPHEKE